MEDSTGTSSRVEAQVRKALGSEALSEAVFEFGDARILFSRGRRLADESHEAETPADYPDVPTALRDDADSWLK